MLNLTASEAGITRNSLLDMTRENPVTLSKELRKLVLPRHHDVRSKDVNLKRLGSVLALAQDRELPDFESLLLLEGLGPRTLQSLVLVSEVIYGTPSRFEDPARFSFAHGGKDGHPFPVPLKVYDETIGVFESAIRRAKLGRDDKQKALQRLTQTAQRMEKDFVPTHQVEEVIHEERNNSWKYGGRSVYGHARKPNALRRNTQLSLPL